MAVSQKNVSYWRSAFTHRGQIVVPEYLTFALEVGPAGRVYVMQTGGPAVYGNMRKSHRSADDAVHYLDQLCSQTRWQRKRES
jgi:hypothetical protein